MIKKCEICREEYSTKYNTSKYCSKCKGKANSQRVIKHREKVKTNPLNIKTIEELKYMQEFKVEK